MQTHDQPVFVDRFNQERPFRSVQQFIKDAVWALTIHSPSRRLRCRLRHWAQLSFANPEPELKGLRHILPARRRVAIDVGANYGYYTLELLRGFQKVVAIEPIAPLVEDLRAFGDRIEIRHEALSDREATATLHIPLLDGSKPMYGWSSLAPGNHPKCDKHQELPIRLRPLDALGIQDVDFIKIDVEGHELETLAGARETIARHRPRVLVEVKDQNIEAARRFFAKLDYKELRFADFADGQGAVENYIFCPSEDPATARRPQ